MSKEEQNKAVVGRWFSEFWGKKEGRRPSGRTRRPCLQKDSPSFCGIVTIEPGNPCVKHYWIITGCLLIASYAFGQSANPFISELKQFYTVRKGIFSKRPIECRPRTTIFRSTPDIRNSSPASPTPR
jgi:hypothetical protein